MEERLSQLEQKLNDLLAGLNIPVHLHDNRSSNKISYNDLLNLPTTYTDRGDASAYDLAATCDGSYHDWDISAIVPADAKLVLLGVQIRSDTAGVITRCRTNGNSNEINAGNLSQATANNYVYGEMLVKPDTNRVVEIYASATFNVCNYVVRGWFV